MANYSDRSGVGPGFDPVSGSVVTGSDNIQNARIDLVALEAARANKTPLFPQSDNKNPLAVPAFQGEFAFVYKPSDSFSSADTTYRNRRGLDSVGSGSWTETGDTIFYNTVLNGVGDISAALAHGGMTNSQIEEAQLAYRSKIRVVGIVRDTVMNTDNNTRTLGNTIVSSKGKITTFNSGFDMIYAGCSLSWDILTSDKASSSGWAKTKLLEPGRLPLICTLTKTLNSSVEETVSEIQDQLRTHKTGEATKKFLKGILAVSSCMDQQIMSLTQNQMRLPGSGYDPFQAVPTQPFFNLHGNWAVPVKALLSLDEDDIASGDFDMVGVEPAVVTRYNLGDAQVRSDAFDFVADGVSQGNQQVSNLNKRDKQKMYNGLAERGLMDVIVGLMAMTSSSQQRFVGIAGSDSIPGNKFDLIL